MGLRKLFKRAAKATKRTIPTDANDERSPRADDERSTFPYRPLPDAGQAWIRLIKLWPSESREEPLQGILLPQSLEEQQSYEALSYAWSDDSSGQQQQPEHILRLLVPETADSENRRFTFNVYGVHISRSLHTALLYLRDKENFRNLWIDAICINQDDLEEKQKQIRMMGRVYSQAEQTIIWLGEPDEGTEHAFEFVRCVASMMESRLKWSAKLHQLLDRQGVTTDIWDSFYTLCNRPWFYRAWTVQEVCLSPRSIVMCGDCSLEWHSFAIVLLAMTRDYVSTKSKVILRQRDPVPRAELFMALKNSSLGNRETVHQLFTGMGGLKATDPRDIMFGVLALLGRWGMALPPIDYTMSTAEIYATATESWVKFNQRLKCLNWATTRPRTQELPSWTIDWEHVRTTNWLWYQPEEKQETPGYPIAATRGIGVQQVQGEGRDWRKLRLQGILLGQHVSGHCRDEHPTNFGDEYPTGKPDEQLRLSFLETPIRWTLFVWNVMASRRHHAEDMSSTLNDFVRALAFLAPREGPSLPVGLGQEREDITKLQTLLEQTAAATKDFLQETHCDGKGALPLELFQTLGARGLLFGREGVQSPERFTFHVATRFEVDMLVCASLVERTLFSTSSGEIGFCCNKEMEDGDVISLLAGSDYPIVLRRTKTEGEYQYVGQAYMDRLMDGYAWPENEEDWETITLV